MKNLRYLLFVLIALFLTSTIKAVNEGDKTEGFKFQDVMVLPATPVKDQYKSGTCWSFSGLSFLESEMLRIGKPEVDLSEMFVVRYSYSDKALKDVRMHGSLNFSAGGAFHDVINVIKKYGIVPEEVYRGLNYGEEKHVHGEMDRVLKSYVDAVILNKNKKLSSVWHESLDAILDTYLGKVPEAFEYEGEEYTPISFARDYVGLDLDNYVEISSYSHQPFYSEFILEVPDNWAWGEVYNVPLNELMEIIDSSLESGYTVAWAADVSEKGFLTSKKGVAVMPEIDLEDMSDTEIAHWDSLSEKEQQEELFKLDKPYKEVIVTQEMRQTAFDNYQTTDDHGMHIIGLAKDQNGEMYYKVKNSWGDYNLYDGYFYASKPYVRYKTTCIMVNIQSIPQHIRTKLNL